MMFGAVVHGKTSGRMRKRKRAQNTDDCPSASSPVAPRKVQKKFRGRYSHIKKSAVNCQELPEFSVSSTGKDVVRKRQELTSENVRSAEPCTSALDSEKCSIGVLNRGTFWNFASSMSRPITPDNIVGNCVATLLMENVSAALRRLISGAKFVMEEAERQKLLCDDLNVFIELEGGKPLYGFMEDNVWQKNGDAYVPIDEILDLSYCSATVQLKTCQ